MLCLFHFHSSISSFLSFSAFFSISFILYSILIYRSCSLLSLSLHLVFVHVCAQDYNKVYVACSSQLLSMFYHFTCDADASLSFRSLSSPSLGLPQWARICRQCRSYRRGGFIPWVRKIPLRRTGQPTPVFLPGESHRQGSPTSYSPYGHDRACTHLLPLYDIIVLKYYFYTHWELY